MISGDLIARHYATREPLRIAWRDGIIVSVEQTTSSTEGRWIAPALVDLQVNGFAGVDFQQDDLAPEQLLAAVRGLGAAGCTRFLLTLVTDDWPRLLRRLRSLCKLRATSPELQHAIAGWHIEGPFLSSEPGFCGAHDPQWMLDPAAEHIHELREATRRDLLLLTVAPERDGALEAIRLSTSIGIKVSLGHTNASAEILQDAVKAGAIAFTHLGNACPRELDRHDNILWRVFDLLRSAPSFHVSLIPDAIHVSPALFRLVHHVLGDAVFHVSDAMAAAGAPPGRHKLGHLELEVGADQIVRFPGRSNFAGSALRPIDGVFRAAQMLDCTWQKTWKHFAEIPARLLGVSSEIAAGAPADFCLIDEREEATSATAPRVTAHVRGQPIK